MNPEIFSTIILLGSFLIMIFLRFPIAYAVGLSTVFCLLSQGQALVTLPQQMVKGVWSYSLMAVPFFITMGVLMGSGGISDIPSTCSATPRRSSATSTEMSRARSM